jgi:hypothetical protein
MWGNNSAMLIGKRYYVRANAGDFGDFYNYTRVIGAFADALQKWKLRRLTANISFRRTVQSSLSID